MPLLAGTAGVGRMAPPASTRIFYRLRRVQGHVSPVHIGKARFSERDVEVCFHYVLYILDCDFHGIYM